LSSALREVKRSSSAKTIIVPQTKTQLAIVVGFEYHVDVFCRKMNAHKTTWQFFACPASRAGIFRALFKLGAANALISFAGPAPHPILLAAARAMKIPVFVIWAGTDVVRVLERPEKITASLRAELTHLAVAPWLVGELKQAGITAHYVPIIGVTANRSVPMPQDKFRVLTYLPEPRRDFYGRRHVYEVANRSPDVEFLVVGPGSCDAYAPSNVTFCGWVPDITPLLDRCTMLLRVPEHDGMSLIVLEALARGRYVAWRYAIPGVRQVQDPNDTLKYMEDLKATFRAGSLSQNLAGLDYMETVYNEECVTTGVTQFLDQSIGGVTRRLRCTRNVAIFGLDIFATDVANLNNNLQTNWNAQVLQFGTRYETVGSLYNLARSDVLYSVGTPMLNRPTRLVAKLLKKPRVVHWVGSDIELARRNPAIIKEMQGAGITHVTEVDWEAEELRGLGISAEIAPLPPRFLCLGRIPDLPADFTVLAYLPASRPDFYGKLELEFLVRALADQPVKFVIVGGGQIDGSIDADIRFLGWRYSLEDVYAMATVLFRFTPRDGLSLMVLEALSFGRYVLWSKKFPFSKHVTRVEEAAIALQALCERHHSRTLRPQADAAEFVKKIYDRERCIGRLTRTWGAACSGAATASKPALRNSLTS
jgi:glycosyltransferase involved in cell wall biosynthesis